MNNIYAHIETVARQTAGLPDGPEGRLNTQSFEEEHRTAAYLAWATYTMLGVSHNAACEILGLASAPRTRKHAPVDLLRRILDTALKLSNEEWVDDDEIEALEIRCDTWRRL